MTVKEAKAVARRWVQDNAVGIPGFVGAFHHGSTHWLPDDTVLPATSDVDIMVVSREPPPVKLGKLVYQGVLLEVSNLAEAEIDSPEQILSRSELAGSFRVPGIIVDPSGRLHELQAAVSRDFAQRKWVEARCRHAESKVLRNLDGRNPADPFHDQVAAWLFATGVTTHVLLSAGLKNPTVRRRYAAVRALLTEYDRLDFYEDLLDMLGCRFITPAQVEQHLAALTQAFDAATVVIKTPFFFASDLSAIARPIAIDGSWSLIERGEHREAVFWLVATYARCLKVFNHDAPALLAQFEPGFRALLIDLGITSTTDLERRCERVRQSLPEVRQVAEAIIAENPDVRA